MKSLLNLSETKKGVEHKIALLFKSRRGGWDLRDKLQEKNYDVKLFRSIGRMVSWLDKNPVQVALIDLEDAQQSPKNIARVREKYPLLPILAIANGTETNCLRDAITSGANHFILDPSDQASLFVTLERLISFRLEYIRYTQVVPFLRTKIEASLPSNIKLLGGIVFYLTEEMFKHGIISLSQVNVKVALIEALTNAMEHGNKLDLNKMVHVQAEFDHEKAVIKIVDEGAGFEVEKLRDPTQEENLYRPRGRGVYMMRQFMDEVEYQPPGNQVTLVKKRSAASVLERPYPWERRTL